MNNIKVTKRFTFPMGHRLPNHKGGCRNLHGHGFILDVTLQGARITDKDSPDEGMVMDFSELKKIVKEFIDNELDHSFMVYSEDLKVLHFLKQNNFKHTIVDFIPTAENMVIWIFDRLKERGLNQIAGVKLWETNTSFAEYNIS